MQAEQKKQKIQEFLARDFNWNFTAGECNFLLQLLAFLVQENPPFVQNQKGEKEPLNYQSIRTIVLLNEKLSAQLQGHARDASVMLGDMDPPPETVQ